MWYLTKAENGNNAPEKKKSCSGNFKQSKKDKFRESWRLNPESSFRKSVTKIE